MTRLRYLTAIGGALVLLAALIRLTATMPPDPAILPPWALFCVLFVFTATFGVPLGEGLVSLLPTTAVAAYLAMGPVPAGWVTFIGALLHGLIRLRWREQLEGRRGSSGTEVLALAAVNATMHTSSVLLGGVAFERTGGALPLVQAQGANLVPLVSLGVTYLFVNYLLAAVYLAIRGRAHLRRYLRSLPRLLLYEGTTLPFAPLMALVLTDLGLMQFVVFSLILMLGSLVMRSLALTSQRLQRRVQELDSLQAVGQALSASLDIETVLWAIYEQVARLMPARNFYVALYDPETDEVSFPLAIEDGERVRWRSRRAGNGLTEYVLRTRTPLLIPRDVEARVRELGVDHIGRPAACWLGVPMLAGDEALGVIALQSYTIPEAYDASHREVLTTIAAQAAVALQNARLYARTDEALARRVQELNSILRTTREGMMLLNQEGRIVAANRALADLLGLPQSELIDHPLTTPRSERETPLLQQIGYTPEGWEADRQALIQGEQDHKRTIVTLGPQGRQVERTLTPVRDRDGTITGWLLVFRDVTEEVELARLKEDLTYMLVHDLRSPLTVLKGSLTLLEHALADSVEGDTAELLAMAHRNTDRILRMVNELLDIGKMESGRLSLRPEPIDVRTLLTEVAARLAPLAIPANITLEIEVEPDLPPLHADSNLIGRVVYNLVDNAVKFAPEGGWVRLWARLDRESTPENLLIGVSDNGPGIPPEEQPRLFKKFQQAGSVGGRRVGTGLGLPFCKLAVEAHGGRIWVESEPGKGSTFVISLPLEQQPPGGDR
ncbi:MAG TPA: GAF domain-containing protein [Chloroflexi bacterium]|nr:GAF domain-containing protein [Chloroflexota bacterium]